jgi:hypothetical protein
MQFGLKVKLFAITLDTSSIADPALAYSSEWTLADGRKLALSIDAQSSRSAADLASAINAALDSQFAPSVNGSVVTLYSLGMSIPVDSEGDFTATATGQEFDNLVGYGISALAGFMIK